MKQICKYCFKNKNIVFSKIPFIIQAVMHFTCLLVFETK